MGFINVHSNKNDILPTVYLKQSDLLAQVELFKPNKGVGEVHQFPSFFPQKSKTFLPLPKINKNSTQLIETYYPKSLLRVKQSINNFQSTETTLIVFDKNKILIFALFCLFSFFIYNFFKNKFFLKQKLNKKLFKKVDVILKKDFILKLKERYFSKLLEDLKRLFQVQTGAKLKSLQEAGAMVLTYSASFSVNSVLVNDFVFMDKVKQNREENTLTFLCKHYFLDIKKNDIVVLTHDLPNLFFYAGTEGVVDRVVLHRQLEVTFFTTANLPEMIPKILLFRYQTSLVKKEDLFF